MKPLIFLFLAGFAGCGAAYAQSGISPPVIVSPALGAHDFRIPMLCASANACAVVSPVLGQAGNSTGVPAGDNPDGTDRIAVQTALTLFLPPTPRPMPGVPFINVPAS